MDEVISSDRSAVSITGEEDEVHVRTGHLQACRHGKDASVVGVHIIPTQVE